LIRETKKLWEEIKNVESEPWPKPDINLLNAENPEDLIRKSDYTILFIDYIDVEWRPNNPREVRSKAYGTYKVISGRWYETKHMSPHGTFSIELYPLTEGEVEIKRKIETSVWRGNSLVPTEYTEHVVCKSFIDLPWLKVTCNNV
jgi:hypothetical protein